MSVKTIVGRGLAQHLEGRDPQHPRALRELMRERTFRHGHGGIVTFAISECGTICIPSTVRKYAYA